MVRRGVHTAGTVVAPNGTPGSGATRSDMSIARTLKTVDDDDDDDNDDDDDDDDDDDEDDKVVADSDGVKEDDNMDDEDDEGRDNKAEAGNRSARSTECGSAASQQKNECVRAVEYKETGNNLPKSQKTAKTKQIKIH